MYFSTVLKFCEKIFYKSNIIKDFNKILVKVIIDRDQDSINEK